MSGQSFVGRILFFDGSFNAWPPGGTEHRGDGKQHQKNKRRVNRNQQANGDLVANSRWVRSLMTLRNHVAAAVMAKPPAAIKTSSLSLSRKPLARNMSQTAINASGNAASNDNKNATDNC